MNRRTLLYRTWFVMNPTSVSADGVGYTAQGSERVAMDRDKRVGPNAVHEVGALLNRRAFADRLLREVDDRAKRLKPVFRGASNLPGLMARPG